MRKKRKSKGWIQYEREAAEIGERVKRGEITNKEAITDELVAALLRAGPNMSKKELVTIHQPLAGVSLAALGGRGELCLETAPEARSLSGATKQRARARTF